MAQNPPRYFAPRYFDAGYWGGDQVEGAISASLGGTGDVAAALTYTQAQVTTGGGRKRRSNYAYLDAKPVQSRPVFIEASISSGGEIAASGSATADMAAGMRGYSQTGTELSATAGIAADMNGAASVSGHGAAKDNWTLAREEEELWLMAA